MTGTGIIRDIASFILYCEINLVYFLSFSLLNYFWFGRETEVKRGKYVMSCHALTLGKSLSLELHSLSIALLDWTIKQKRGI